MWQSLRTDRRKETFCCAGFGTWFQSRRENRQSWYFSRLFSVRPIRYWNSICIFRDFNL